MTSCNSNNSHVIEVDGICFETLLPERIYRLPKYEEETPIQFGVRITNNSSTPYRFELPRFEPEILNPHGKPIQIDFARNATRRAEEYDIPLISPGESLDYFMDGKFSWYSGDCIRLSGYGFYGGIWSFYNFKSSKYQIRFTYENCQQRRRIYVDTIGDSEYNDFWTGKITTSLAKLRLR
jgi:hypothetical protein